MANRETRRREKKQYKVKEETLDTDISASSSIKIGAAVIGVFILFYIITTMITNSYNDSRKDLNKPPVSIQYEEILAGELFNMYDDEYYVVFFDFKDSSAAIYASILEKYEADSDIKVYKVDLSKGFNEPYISEESNPNVKKIGDLKINGPTLIKIKNKKNVLYVEGKDSIEEVLK